MICRMFLAKPQGKPEQASAVQVRQREMQAATLKGLHPLFRQFHGEEFSATRPDASFVLRACGVEDQRERTVRDKMIARAFLVVSVEDQGKIGKLVRVL